MAPQPTAVKTKPLTQRAFYPVAYMFTVTFVFCAVLIGLARFTHARVEANRQVQFERAVLMSVAPGLGAAETRVDSDTPPDRVHELFVSLMEQPGDATGGAYRYRGEDAPAMYALPFEGQGFWNIIKGVAGISADGTTLTGIAFYLQNETPGLGARIVQPDFCDQFEGKRLAAGEHPITFRAEGSTVDEDEVHAITGATQTCTRLEGFLNRALAAWRAQAFGGGTAE